DFVAGGNGGFERVVADVVAFVDAPRNGFDLPLDIRGTAFQQRVWQALRGIPCGETATYAEIARRIGAPGSARAVAGACAANPLAVAIPCHRVIAGDGRLSGYRWGVERKRALLDSEVQEWNGQDRGRSPKSTRRCRAKVTRCCRACSMRTRAPGWRRCM